MLTNAPRFLWRNYSVPEHDPLKTRTDRGLEAKLHNQIGPTNIVIILAGMYATHSKWIKKEIKIAKSYRKPIIGIQPRGRQRTPVDVQAAAKTMVGWNTQSIVSAIRRYAI